MHMGNIFVISAPSGAGKSSLVRALCDLDENIQVSVSHTTRKKRPGEIHGVDYYFVNNSEFEEMLTKNQFLEHALVYNNHYGTSTEMVKNSTNKGFDIILEIDYQGAFQIRNIFATCTLIYILPPSKKELEARLVARNTDSDAAIKQRLELAKTDISHAKDFDFAVINDNFDVALHHIYSIIRVQRLVAKNVLADYTFR